MEVDGPVLAWVKAPVQHRPVPVEPGHRPGRQVHRLPVQAVGGGVVDPGAADVTGEIPGSDDVWPGWVGGRGDRQGVQVVRRQGLGDQARPVDLAVEVTAGQTVHSVHPGGQPEENFPRLPPGALDHGPDFAVGAPAGSGPQQPLIHRRHAGFGLVGGGDKGPFPFRQGHPRGEAQGFPRPVAEAKRQRPRGVQFQQEPRTRVLPPPSHDGLATLGRGGRPDHGGEAEAAQAGKRRRGRHVHMGPRMDRLNPARKFVPAQIVHGVVTHSRSAGRRVGADQAHDLHPERGRPVTGDLEVDPLSPGDAEPVGVAEDGGAAHGHRFTFHDRLSRSSRADCSIWGCRTRARPGYPRNMANSRL